jgi:TetR/AcrR family transcriptional regulator, transcriptional repressor for nem operon
MTGTVRRVALKGELSKGEATRQRILEIAQASVLTKGFGATSIEEVIAEAKITKSGFFYHFKDKNELARELLRRYVEADEKIFDDVFGRAEQLTDDPLQRFLIGLRLLSEVLGDLPNGHPGCLVASICYQERLFDREVCETNTQAIISWNRRFLGYLELIAEIHPPKAPVDLSELASMLSCVLEGAIILSKVLKDPKELERQVMVYQRMIKVLFAP